MNNLVRFRYNTMASETPNGEWYWRVILETPNGFLEVLARQLVVNVPSFSKEDEMAVVGRKFHLACYGTFRLDEDGVGFITASLDKRATALNNPSILMPK